MTTKRSIKQDIVFIVVLVLIAIVVGFLGDLLWLKLYPDQYFGIWGRQEAAATTEATPEPEEFTFGGYYAMAHVVSVAAELCKPMPVWLLHPDSRDFGVGVRMTSPDSDFATGKAEETLTYVAFGKVFINDRLVEFAPEGVEVFQIFEDHVTFELNPESYITRATEILNGDVQPVEIIRRTGESQAYPQCIR